MEGISGVGINLTPDTKLKKWGYRKEEKVKGEIKRGRWDVIRQELGELVSPVL